MNRTVQDSFTPYLMHTAFGAGCGLLVAAVLVRVETRTIRVEVPGSPGWSSPARELPMRRMCVNADR
jgi:hypothetical protein